MILKEFLKNPLEIGAIAETSKYTAKFINSLIPEHSNVLEIGSGRGAITKYINKKIHTVDHSVDTCKYIDNGYHYFMSFEEVFQRNNFDINYYNTIVSSVPTTLMNFHDLNDFLHLIKENKPKETTFIQLNYSKRLNDVYRSFFDITYQKVVWRNLPPAVITVMK